MGIIHKIERKLTKLRLQPIRVFCFHQVSEVYNPLIMWECDWVQIDRFKQNILQLKSNGVEFISLLEAHEKLKHDRFRPKHYAVLTADDGYKTLLNILPWLEGQQIPITLFINTKYLDGQSWSENNEEQARRIKPDVNMLTEVCPSLYLSEGELQKIAASPWVTIGLHGHEHLDATKISIEKFRQNVELCMKALKNIPHTIPYYSYPWELHSGNTDAILKEHELTPVLMNGRNWNNTEYISREVLEGKIVEV